MYQAIHIPLTWDIKYVYILIYEYSGGLEFWVQIILESS